ncbi:AlbA family DNA-binding domain-containing protein [Cyclobacterium jeungdonense]|uniref:ATP-binding protein n=1 Tax=Cyclobacterium jeungdonense TaxID=708087 RepID=A0ABT8CCM7_9BACT|nr:ATP-binding protein [Cyclobacterium jeungdonense]MDN3690564.1 ATP-binding protein [Cyclobacterium jeungdonense]
MFSPKKNNEWIKSLLAKPEGLHLDYKQSLSSQRKIAKTLLSFANTEGGTVVVGVSDRKQILGIDPEEEMFMANEAITKYCAPSFPVTFEVYEVQLHTEPVSTEEKYLLLIHVPKSDRGPHALAEENQEPVYYRRKHDRSVPFQLSDLH